MSLLKLDSATTSGSERILGILDRTKHILAARYSDVELLARAASSTSDPAILQFTKDDIKTDILSTPFSPTSVPLIVLLRSGVMIVGAVQSSTNIVYEVVKNQATTDSQLENDFGARSKENRSTSEPESSANLYRNIESLFHSARAQEFESGMESEFSRNIISIVKQFGGAALEVIASLVLKENVNPETAAEALNALSRLDDARTYDFRLWLLERSLKCSSTRVRDAALLGLSSLDDPHSIEAISHAIELEQLAELRSDMHQVLSQLKAQCRLF